VRINAAIEIRQKKGRCRKWKTFEIEMRRNRQAVIRKQNRDSTLHQKHNVKHRKKSSIKKRSDIYGRNAACENGAYWRSARRAIALLYWRSNEAPLTLKVNCIESNKYQRK